MTTRVAETWWAAYDGDGETWLRARPNECDGAVVKLEMYPSAREEQRLDVDLSLEHARELAQQLLAICEEYEEHDGDSLRTLREERGLSQKEAAERVGVSVRTYQAWERGEVVPSDGRMAQIEEALAGIEPVELVEAEVTS